MGVNGIFCIMMLLGLLYAAATGRADAAQRALLSGGGEAVTLLLNLAGAYAFFGGLLGVLRACGAADALARAMEKPLSRLLRFAPGEEEALSDISRIIGQHAGSGRRGDAGRHIGDEDHGARQSGRAGEQRDGPFSGGEYVERPASADDDDRPARAGRSGQSGGYRAAHAAGDGGFNRVRRGNMPSSGRGERRARCFCRRSASR